MRVAMTVAGLATLAISGCSACSDSHTPGLDEDTGVVEPMDGSVPMGDGSSGEDGGGAADATTGDDASVPTGAPTGAPCSRASDCAAASVGEPECLPGAFGWPGGYCTNGECDPALDDCPGDGVCEVGDDGSACLDACDPAADDCRAGYECFDASTLLGGSTRYYCLPLCVSDADCMTGERCDTEGADPSHLCYRPGVALGQPCTDRSDCGLAQFCLAEDPFGFPGGYCTSSCDASVPGDCGAGGVCVGDGPDGLCLAACSGAGDCRSGYRCDDQLIFAGMLSADACLPDCTSASDCTVAGNQCEIVMGLCQPPLDPAAFGGPCTSDADCRGGGCLEELEDGAPHGYCIDECDPAGTDPSDCPAGGTCIGIGAIPFGICLTSCDPMAPMCRPGYTCPSFGLVTDVCITDCSESAQCASGCCSVGRGGPFDTGRCVDPAGSPPPMCLPSRL